MIKLPEDPPSAVVQVFRQLQTRQRGLGYEDLLALRQALRAGFGLESRDKFVELCVALWAKSPSEAAIVRMLFARQDLADWYRPAAPVITGQSEKLAVPRLLPTAEAESEPRPVPIEAPLTTAPVRVAGVPPLPVRTSRRIVLAFEFPLTQRAIAQTFRRLRQPVRTGAATELDVDATVTRRARLGVASPPVLVARRRNVARLILLIDRQGSMAPLHPYLDYVRDAIAEQGRLETVVVRYFHDSPCDRADQKIMVRLRGLFPTLDEVLSDVEPRSQGVVFTDPELLCPEAVDGVLDETWPGAGVLILSDAGAIRRSYNAERLVTAVAFARANRQRGHRLVWLNPVPREQWKGSTADEIRRHVAMFALNRSGLHQAVDVLRGKPVALERPA
jgi:uncharacterized protein with von Willebrand factor type A (vWA) domain